MKIEDKIQKQINKIAEEVRKYSISQKAEWQKIPWLALQVDGRGGYSTGYSIAYEIGVWEIANSGIFVNLENGDLVSILCYPKSNCECTKVGDYSILKIVGCFSEELNAKKIISRLEENILKSEDTPYCGYENFKSNIEWRNSIINKYDLKKDFYRRMK